MKRVRGACSLTRCRAKLRGRHLDHRMPVPGERASEIRRAFAVLSQSAVRASQGAPAVQLDGFGN